MSLEKDDLEYFDLGEIKNPIFWSRLGGEPSFEGLKVLDVGCGHGSLCVSIASKGAKKVVGIDINERRIKFCKGNILRNYPHLKNILDFRCCETACFPDVEFDIIVSKYAFEHISNLDLALAEMKRILKIGGKIYVGFGPLYNSLYGNHGQARALIPWGHLIFHESFLLKRLNKHRCEKLTRICLGLNRLSFAEYKTLFYNSGLHISYFRVNVGNNPIVRLFSLIRRIPLLEEFFSYNLYCIFEKQP